MKVELTGNIKGIRRVFSRNKDTGQVEEYTVFSVQSEGLDVGEIRRLVQGLPGSMFAKISIESPQTILDGLVPDGINPMFVEWLKDPATGQVYNPDTGEVPGD
mgnify:CR=1 FL=1